ncbi:PIN domain-containing protein [Candidatus Shapirobacteria bacterium]|nr:PIN domain-containing protein [Candidatus Shapirobacteria bacterium]
MKTVILDSSIIIDHARGKGKALIQLLKLQEKKKIELIVPTIVVFEFYSGLSLEKREILKNSELLFSKFKVISINEEIAKTAAQINRKCRLYQKISVADLLIGAAAICLSGYLATKNIKDFKKIPDLKILPLPR